MSYEHCALGPMAPTEEDRRAARARERARMIERLSKSSVKVPERWSRSALRRSDTAGGTEREREVVAEAAVRFLERKARDQRALRAEVHRTARRLGVPSQRTGHPAEREREEELGYFSKGKATR